MSKIQDGGPAFPHSHVHPHDQCEPSFCSGLSLRDYFAAKALASMRLASGWTDNPLYWDGVAKSAYVCADAMIKAREQSHDA